mgnify:CR=1 FL=1
MQVGDLVKYRWWVDENGEDGAPSVALKKKREEIGVLVSLGKIPFSASEESRAEYIKVHFTSPKPAICDVPKFKIETIVKENCPNPGCYCMACEKKG